MNEREGFESFCKRTNPKYRTTDDSVIDRAAWRIWREACAWQREQNATDCERADVEHQSTTPAGASMYCAKLIRGQVANF